MGAVFAASARSGRFAVKILHADLAKDARVRDRFAREAYLGNRVGHKGVPRTLEHGYDADGSPYLVMDLLEGWSLDAVWQHASGRLPARDVLSYADRILDVLDAAHTKGVIHRDIKPENVFLTTSGELKLLDFGIARVLDGTGATRSGELMGTPGFMPPEQAGGHVKQIDPRTDLWAVGAVMFSLLSGQHVHDAKTGVQQIIYAATQRARSVTTVAPGLPIEIVRVIDTALQFERERRWQSAAAMRANIMAAAMLVASEGRIPSAPAPSSPVGPHGTAPLGRLSLDPPRKR
jgi:serine/threonine-protein kinase